MKTKILALLFLIALVSIQAQFVAFAAEPPGIGSPLADDDDDTDPPALGGDDDDDTDPPALGGDDDDDTSDPVADDTSGGTGSGSGGTPLPTGDDDDDSVEGSGTGTTGGSSGSTDGTNIISETGPAMGILLVPSLILGYAYKKVSKK